MCSLPRPSGDWNARPMRRSRSGLLALSTIPTFSPPAIDISLALAVARANASVSIRLTGDSPVLLDEVVVVMAVALADVDGISSNVSAIFTSQWSRQSLESATAGHYTASSA